MATIGDISVARRYEIYKTARKLQLKYDNSFARILTEEKITLIKAGFNDDKNHAFVIVPNKLIVLSNSASDEDSWFAVNHELGHIFLRHGDRVFCRELGDEGVAYQTVTDEKEAKRIALLLIYNNILQSAKLQEVINLAISKYGLSQDKQLEREANYFAAVLAAPYKMMIAGSKKNDKELAAELGVAEKVIKIRREEVALEDDYDFEEMVKEGIEDPFRLATDEEIDEAFMVIEKAIERDMVN